MYTRGSVIAAATIINPEIYTTPNFYMGPKRAILASFATTLEFEPLWFDHGTPGTLQVFEVKGIEDQSHGVKVQGHSVT